MEEKRPGEYFPVNEDEHGTYIMNSKDLCMIENIPELINAGIYSLKIEGRMKSSYYVATAVKAYREAVDEYFKNPETYTFKQKWMDYLLRASHRRYSTGFYFGEKAKQYYESSSYIRDYDIVGIVRDYNTESKIATIEQRNRVFEGDTVEVLRPEGDLFNINLDDMKNASGCKINVAPNAQMVFTIISQAELKKDDMLVKANK